MRRLDLIRTLRLPCYLAAATAEWIVSDAQDAGNRAFDDPFGHEPKGNDIHNQIARTQYRRREAQARLDWEKDITPDPEIELAQAAAFAALRSGQVP